MKSISRVMPLPFEGESPRTIKLASTILPLLAGLILGLLILAIGSIALPIIFFVFIILPLLLKDTFRLFIWLIVTWPILTLYVRIPLPAGIPDLSYDRVLVLLLLCLVILEALLLKRRLLKVTPLDILVLAYVVAQLSSRLFVLWFGGTGRQDLNGLLDIILIPVALYWITKNLLVSRSHLNLLLYAFFVASLVICLSGLYEQAVGGERKIFTISTQLGGLTESQMKHWMDVPGGRAAGPMGNPAIYGATLGIGILAAICGLAHVKQKLHQVALVAAIAVLLYGVLSSYTRSAWISVFAVLFIAQFLINGLWKRTLPIFMLGLLLLILMWDELPRNSIIVTRALTTDSIISRVGVTQLALEQFPERPFWGWGSGALDAFGIVQTRVSSHNIFLTYLVDGGLVLFLAASAVFGRLLIRGISVYRKTEKHSFERHFAVAMMGSVLIYLLSGLALELRYFGYFNALFWIAAGAIDRLGLMCEGDWVD